MGLYKNTNGVLSPIAGRGKAEYGASTVRTGTIAQNTVINANGVDVYSATFDSPMPDTNYCIDFSFVNESNYSFTYGVKSKTINGFSILIGRPSSSNMPANSITINYKAYKLYTDNEYNSIQKVVSSVDDYSRNILPNPIWLAAHHESIQGAGFEDAIECEAYNNGTILIYDVGGEATEEVLIPIVPKEIANRNNNIANVMLFEPGKEYIFSVHADYGTWVAQGAAETVDFSQYFSLKIRFRLSSSSDMDVPFTVITSDRKDRLAVRFTVPTEAANVYGYLDKYNHADPLLYEDKYVYTGLYFVLKNGFTFDMIYENPYVPQSWRDEDAVCIDAMVQEAPPEGIPVDLDYRRYISTPDEQYHTFQQTLSLTGWGTGAKLKLCKIGRVVWVCLSTGLVTPSSVISGWDTVAGNLLYDFKPMNASIFSISNSQTNTQVLVKIEGREIQLKVLTGAANTEVWDGDLVLGSYIAYY